MAHHKLLVFCGPSGSGKSTLVNKMMLEYPDKFGFSVSHTTRNPRPGELNGKHYYFTTKEAIQQSIDDGNFIETAVFSGNIYGTSKAAVEDVIHRGKVCVLDIDVQGVKQIKKSSYKPWYVFVAPPSLEELENRLRGRNTENEESLQQRLTVANEELVYGNTPGNFDLIIINNDLNHAYNALKGFLVQNVLKNFINGN
ncbi:guanylate kinase isoform X1 [Sitophilus oryzae]|uniref:guanylate kinase n=1 Tax=Sitophilus oryzae TaxID=7048 RepID=A0A6J2XB68_SITOR|nr:guanylate kinase isoform X1 [Sitophilus oryzae]XP_030748402.1 guanylate kinase isoform X1 [Sitophilus oryzae]XP_030748403.1 guanylate kinase isoform X1 [Sitophilus oryzae]XP_030748404.1 guanylate kinase isoform X1 [Sitophilus oryzae]XP_030748405.1 guanylate kinase isoform X1 [Sitophilus oryzae]XP_030748406.1 guanylate kinase isoform X1 [Sitophilus oryzae]